MFCRFPRRDKKGTGGQWRVLWQSDSFCFGSAGWMAAQEDETSIHVEVDMVQLNVAVMDSKGNYVTGLKPSDFVVTEDGIAQKVATFGEGNEATRRVTANGDDDKPGQ